MELKRPLSFREQVLRLKEHGILVKNEVDAEKIMSQINYYRLTGYALQFRKQPDNSDYIERITFEQIYSIYQFDEELRCILRKYIEKAEIYYRTRISYGFSTSKCNKEPHNQHYDEKNFYNKRGFHEIMDNFKREKNYYKDSLVVKHHKEKYSDQMPLWVIVELMSFSSISKLYSSMYISEQRKIAEEEKISSETLSNHLHCLSVLRNKCAHAVRLYNTEFNPPDRFNSAFLKKNPTFKNNSLLAYILVLIKRMPDQESRENLFLEINKLMAKYTGSIENECIGFIDGYHELLKHSVK